MSLKVVPYDAAEILTDDETIAEYLTVTLEEGDPKLLARAVAAVIRALKARGTNSTHA